MKNKNIQKKKTLPKILKKKSQKNSLYFSLKSRCKSKIKSLHKRQKDFLSRRPHRSFKLTRRRDHKRSLKLPGYWSLTVQVFQTIWKNKKLFGSLALLYLSLALLSSSLMSQEAFEQTKSAIEEANQSGGLGKILPVLFVSWSVMVDQVANATTSAAGSSQQVIASLFTLFTWLSTIWLMRGILAGHKLRMRDGVYSSGGPIIALLVLTLVLLIQMLPAALALMAYGAADASGLLDQTVILMLFAGGAVLLSMMSLYWAVATIIAMVIITLPGMYPMQAIKLAGDLVVGRRTRILLRLAWLAIVLTLTWAVFLIPTILLDGALKSAVPDLSWLPLVPIVALLLMTASVIFSASYIYIFYRRIVDDGSAPV